MIEKFQRFYKKLKRKVTSTPAYARLLWIRDKLAKPILNGLLACFTFLSPCWTFLFIKKEDFNGENEFADEISKK